MRRVRILELAAEEATKAASWYEAEQPGLGKDFSTAVEAALDLIEKDILPLIAVPGDAGSLGAKRITLRRFPYDIVALERPGEVLVLPLHTIPVGRVIGANVSKAGE